MLGDRRKMALVVLLYAFGVDAARYVATRILLAYLPSDIPGKVHESRPCKYAEEEDAQRDNSSRLSQVGQVGDAVEFPLRRTWINFCGTWINFGRCEQPSHLVCESTCTCSNH